MTVRRIGTRKDALRRLADAFVAAALPGGASLFLFWLARSGPGDGAIVEIGSYRGRSTLCLATGVKGRRTTRIAAVDPHVYETEGHLRENLTHFGLSKIVEPIVATSVAAGPRLGRPGLTGSDPSMRPSGWPSAGGRVAAGRSVLRISNPLKETGCAN